MWGNFSDVYVIQKSKNNEALYLENFIFLNIDYEHEHIGAGTICLSPDSILSCHITCFLFVFVGFLVVKNVFEKIRGKKS